jgi:hypothetical protein
MPGDSTIDKPAAYKPAALLKIEDSSVVVAAVLANPEVRAVELY